MQGSIALERLERLGQYLSSHHGEVEAVLDFGQDGDRGSLISGTLRATLSMLCQRCLGEARLDLETVLAIPVTRAELIAEGANAHGDLETVAVEEDELDLHGLLEDELILSLPIVVRHEEEDCNAILNALTRDPGDDPDVSGAESGAEENPFEVLQQLKGTLKK